MKGLFKKLLAVLLTVAVILSLLPEGFGAVKAEAASKVEFGLYTYGTNPSADCGAIIAPTTPGTYRVAIVQHGDLSYASVADNMKKCMQKWVDEGLIEPMIIVTPYVIQNGGYNDHGNFTRVQLPKVVERINDGTFEKKLNCNIDKSKKIALTGYSLGGAVTAYGGMKYKDTFPYLGIISPSPFGLYPGGVWKDWIPNDPETKDYMLSTDSDHLFMMFSGLNEPQYDDVLNVYYNEFGKDKKFTKVAWKDGYHRIDYFSQSVFYFLYTLLHGTEPSDSEITKANTDWNTTITRTVVRNGASIAKAPINGSVHYAENTISGKVEVTVGFYIRAIVSKDCNAKDSTCNQESRTPYSYKWKRDGVYIDGERKSDYLLCDEDVGHKITCEVSSITGKYSGCLTVTSETIKGNGSNPKPTPTPTAKPTSTPTAKPTSAPTAKPTSAPTAKPTQAPTAKPTLTPQKALSGTIAFAKNDVTGVVEAKYGFNLIAVVKNCNATSLSYQWKRGDSVISGATEKYYMLQKEDIGKKITCTVSDKTGKLTGTLSVTSEEIQKQDGPAAPSGLKAVSATKGGEDGKITGTSKAMEYSAKSDFSTKTACTGSEITGLGAGTYYVRYAETDTQKHSNYVTVTVGEKEQPAPTAKPTAAPTAKPTSAPTAKPTQAPTAKPTQAPTAKPNEKPTSEEQSTSEEQKTSEEKKTEDKDTNKKQKASEDQTTTEEKKTVVTTDTTDTTETTTENKDVTEGKTDEYLEVESVSAEQLKKDKLIKDKKSGGKYKILKVKKKKGKVVSGTVSYMAPYIKECKKAKVPDYIKIAGVKFKVTEINKKAFKNIKTLRKLSIGKNVTKIGKEAFRGCTNLKSVNIRSKKLKKIGAKAFKGISRNAKFKVPKNKLSYLTKKIKAAKAPKSVKVNN